MSKKKKRRQREIAAIWLRMFDMARGAVGHYGFDTDDEEGGLLATMGAEEWLRWLAATRASWLDTGWECGMEVEPGKVLGHTFEFWNLHRFAGSLDEAAEFLWEQGARA